MGKPRSVAIANAVSSYKGGVDARNQKGDGMLRNGLAAMVLVAAAGAAGCLVKETTHRLYLSPSGAVAWVVLEEGVRSNENDRLKRTTEEQEWLDSVAMSTHSVAQGLRRLGTDQTSTTLLRPARPYMAMTDARFDHVDRVIARLFEELGLRGEATLTAGRGETTLSVALNLSSLDDAGPEPESPVTALLEDVERYRLVLTEGRFVSATGFAIVDDGTAAMLQEIPSEILKARGVVSLKLVWRPTP